MRKIGLFGGTFDPIHNAHLRLALEIKYHCLLDEMRLLPAHIPPHKGEPSATPEQRLAMLRLALEQCPQLGIDARELERHKPSYTIETLEQIRAEVGPDVGLYWSVGGDSLASLDRWHRWQELLDYCHLVVAVRPGYHRPNEGSLVDFLKQHESGSVVELASQPRGFVHVVELTQLAISATQIRAEISAGRSAQFLMPDAVWRYAQQQELYQH